MALCASKYARASSDAVAARSTSPRTVPATVRAMVESATDSQSTARSALPADVPELPARERRSRTSVVKIFNPQVLVYMHGCSYSHGLKPGWIGVEGPHLDADGQRPFGSNPAVHPAGGLSAESWSFEQKAAVGQLVGEHERFRTGLNRPEERRTRIRDGIEGIAEAKRSRRCRSTVRTFVHHQAHAPFRARDHLVLENLRHPARGVL